MDPKFNLPFEFQMKLFEEASILEEEIRKSRENLQLIKEELRIDDSDQGKVIGNGKY